MDTYWRYVGDGIVKCPGQGCGLRYCARCGNGEHGSSACPPSSDMLRFLDKHSKTTKRCPNCATAIEKNGGCAHMHCAPGAGGCGHHFTWSGAV